MTLPMNWLLFWSRNNSPIILATTSAAIHEISSWDKILGIFEVNGKETSPQADDDTIRGRIGLDGALPEVSPFIMNNLVKHVQTSKTQQYYHYCLAWNNIKARALSFELYAQILNGIITHLWVLPFVVK